MPELPAKHDLEKQYVDEARILGKINDAIDAAEEARWDDCETALQLAEGDLETWEPYDQSDVYYRGMWQSEINQIRAFAATRGS